MIPTIIRIALPHYTQYVAYFGFANWYLKTS